MPAPPRKRQPTAKGKEAIEQANSTARKRPSGTLDSSDDDVQVAQTPAASRLKLSAPKETPKHAPLKLHGPKETPKHTPLKINGPRPISNPLRLNGPRDSTLHDRMLAALHETQSTNSSMPPPPAPPESNSTDSLLRACMDIATPRPPIDFPTPEKGLFRKLVLAKKAAEALDIVGTPTPSRIYDISAGVSQASGTQDYYTGTQQDRASMGRSQDRFFEAHRPYTRPEDKEEEDDNNTVDTMLQRNRPWTRSDSEADEADNDHLGASTLFGNDNTPLSQQSKATAKTAKTATKEKTTAEGRKDSRKATEGRKKAESQAPVDIDTLTDDIVKYRLFRKCYYEGKECGGTRRLNPTIKGDRGSEIVLEDLIAEEHALAIQTANEAGLACHRVSIRAVPSHTRMTQKDRQDSELDMQEDQSLWKQLEDDIRQWSGLKRTDLTIHLTSNWGRRPDGTIPPPTPTPTPIPSQNDASLRASRPRTTATTKLVAEKDVWQAKQSPSQATNQELLAKWRCLKTGCNEGRHCYIDGKGEHYPLTPLHTMCWARDIQEMGTSTKEQPSGEMFKMLKMAKKGYVKDAKKARQQQEQVAPATVIAPVAPHAPGPTINYYIGRGPDDELPRQRSTTRFVSATPQRATATPAPYPPQRSPPSSPVRGEQYTLKDYIDWHIKKQPAKKELLTRAYNSLEDECYRIHHIQQWKDTTDPAIQKAWRDLSIPLGLGRQLAEDASTFARQHEHGHARQMTIRESPRKGGTWQQPAQRRDTLRPSIEVDEDDLDFLYDDVTQDDANQGPNLVGGEDLDDSQAFLGDE